MDLIQLKMPPDKARIMAEALERDVGTTGPTDDNRELRQIITWLRYRIDRWEARHPGTRAS